MGDFRNFLKEFFAYGNLEVILKDNVLGEQEDLHTFN
jgi:hypothetical protein